MMTNKVVWSGLSKAVQLNTVYRMVLIKRQYYLAHTIVVKTFGKCVEIEDADKFSE